MDSHGKSTPAWIEKIHFTWARYYYCVAKLLLNNYVVNKWSRMADKCDKIGVILRYIRAIENRKDWLYRSFEVMTGWSYPGGKGLITFVNLPVRTSPGIDSRWQRLKCQWLRPLWYPKFGDLRLVTESLISWLKKIWPMFNLLLQNLTTVFTLLINSFALILL